MCILISVSEAVTSNKGKRKEGNPWQAETWRCCTGSEEKSGRPETESDCSDKSALAKIERGERVPSLETVSKLADEMDVPMASWFQDEASHSASVMEQFIESRNNRLEKLSSEQLSSLQKMIDQALLMAGV